MYTSYPIVARALGLGRVRRASKGILHTSIDNAKAFQSYLANTDFTPLFRSNNVDDAFNILDTNLNKYHAHFFPLKVIKRHPKFIYKPSQESLNAIKLKNKFHDYITATS